MDTAKHFLGRSIPAIMKQLDFERIGKVPTTTDGPVNNGMVYRRPPVLRKVFFVFAACRKKE
ncbi:hypothetical protein S1OALGB6SA_37 [Olavius algarvensis spirochete endosymbiont]|nr:hypothetical protein S1OALGB6SA_37 [Olavius algarvensis spirochete endosymbiont]